MGKVQRVSYFILLLVILCFINIACEHNKNAAPNTLTIGVEASPANLDPRKALDAMSHKLTQLIFGSLVRLDESSNIVPDVAKSWENPDNKTYIFNIKQGIFFHHGREVCAQDIKYTFDSILDPNFNSPKRATYSVISDIQAIDRYTVKFSLKEPFAPFLINMVMGIVPQDIAQKEGVNFETNPVGSGPFKFDLWLTDEKVVLSAFDRYSGGRPKLDQVVFKIIPDDTVRILELKKGSIDLIQNDMQPDMIRLLQRESEFQIETSPGTNFSYLGFNLRDPILKNKLVREAIAHGINREAIIEHILKGMARPAMGLLPSTSWAFEPGSKIYKYDPDESCRLLDQAGFFDPDADGPDARFKLTYKTSQNELGKRVAEVIQDNLSKIGIKVDLRSLEWGTYFSDIQSGNFQIYSLQWVGITDPDIYYYIFHSNSIPPNGANRSYYINSEIDKLIEEARVATEIDLRKSIYSEIQKILANDLPYINLWHWDNIVIMKKNISGYRLYPSADFISLIDTRISQ